jgi:UDP-N-acetylmuramoyl-tripeptide--D-alanyl-D-alanine ligase
VQVHKSVKSYNNHTGVPLSLARMAADSDFGVFEMGMNHAGEIAALTRMVRPHVATITAIAPAHIEFFANGLAGIADAKSEIFQGLEPGGTAIIPFDTPWRDRLIEHAKPYAGRILTFGTGDGADVRAREAVAVETGSLVAAVLPDSELSFTVGQHGAHWVSNALAVLATVYALGGDLCVAGLALADLGGLPGRGARYRLSNGALLIDESYNANAASMAATLDVLGQETAGRRIAVLGEMRELGAESDALHAGIAQPLLAARPDHVILVGAAMTPLADAIRGKVAVEHYVDTDAACDFILPMVAVGDVVLVKGSNGVGLSALVKALREA